MEKIWIGVDMDGTLSHNGPYQDKHPTSIGVPLLPMVKKVQQWIKDGEDVRIFTARVSPLTLEHHNVTLHEMTEPIKEFCIMQFGTILPITHEKDCFMREIWDDIAFPVEKNTGRQLPICHE
jgi:hypothetical protein